MDLRTLDLNLLKAFDVLMEERNVTRAASRLALTQPAVSGILNRLRESFDDPLFVRTPRGITPTPRALELGEPVKRVLASVESLLHPTDFDPARMRFTIALAATDYALKAIVVPFVAAARVAAPGVRVAVRPVDERSVADQLERGDIDMALLTPEGAPPDLHCRTLFDETYVCVLRDGHPSAGRGHLDLDEFCRLDHGMVSLEGGGFLGATDDALQRLGRARRVTLSVPSFLALLEVVRTSDLVALVPRRLLAGALGVTTVEPPLEVGGFTKVLCWHARTHDDPRHRWARALLAEICGSAT